MNILDANTPRKSSIDIEMRVTSGSEDAHLDIGVFAPWEYMHVEDAQEVVEQMRVQLRALG